MSSIESIIQEALALDIVLYLKEGQLAFVTGEQGFPDALKQQVRDNKEGIIQYLSNIENSGDQVSSDSGSIQPRDRTKDTPLSFSQQRLWFVDKFEGQSAQFNMVNVFKLSGKLDVTAFKKSIATIVERHEVLRTQFIEKEGVPLQLINEEVSNSIQIKDFKHLPEQERNSKLQSLIVNEANETFDLTLGLLIRTHLIKISVTEHVVIFNLHHIASDGWSLGILVADFCALYNAYSTDDDNPLSPLKLQYGDYAASQREWLKGDALQEQLQYWTEKLDNYPTVHQLPLDKARPAQQTYQGDFHYITIDSETTQNIRDFCKQQDVTLFAYLQTVFALMVSRLSGEDDVVMGTPLAGRTHQDVEPLIGFFINSLVLRNDFSINEPFNQYLKRSKAQLFNDFANQTIPFEMLVEALSPDRDPAISPLFQIVFGLNNTNAGQLDLNGLTIETLPNEVKTAKVDLEISITEDSNNLGILWSFNTDLFLHNSIVNMAKTYHTLLQQCMAQPETPILGIPLVDECATQDLLMAGIGEITNANSQSNLVSRFQYQVEKTPDAIAAIQGEQRLSYQQLDDYSNQLANYLLECELESNARVGILIDRSIEQLIATLAALKSGVCYVPLDPSHPQNRIDFIIADADIELVLLDQNQVEKFPLNSIDVLVVEPVLENKGWLSDYETVLEQTATITSEQLAYLLYTSGSTGQPKGVMITHGGLDNYIQHALSQYMCNAIQGAVVCTPLCFDATITSLMSPLCCGKTVLLLSNDDTMLDQLSDQLFATDSWLFKLTPAHLNAIEQKIDSKRRSVAAHVLIIGGEQLTVNTLSQWKKNHLPEASFINEYGPTETVVGCSIYRIDTVEQVDALNQSYAVPVGKAIQNTQLFVLNKQMKEQPIGGVGELYIAGAGVAQGYVNRAELTQQQFIQSSQLPREMQSLVSSETLYKTGDQARWLAGGVLEFIGRLDEQVKVRGYRIELAEIEKVLLELESVHRAVVVLNTSINNTSKSQSEDAKIIAYIIPEEQQYSEYDSNADSNHSNDKEFKKNIVQICRQSVKKSLPEYMMPSHWMMIDSLPLTTNGKLDRNALPKPDGQTNNTEKYVAPANELEAELQRYWCQLLELGQVSVTRSFFDVGGHSLLALRLLSHIRESFDVELSLKALFAAPTIQSLANTIQSSQSKSKLPAITVVSQNEQDHVPLSFAQQRLWFIDKMEGSSLQYNMPGLFRLTGQLNQLALNTAFEQILQRHEVLRTTYHEHLNHSYQKVNKDVSLPIQVLDVSDQKESSKAGEIKSLIHKESITPFDLGNDVMLRVTLIKENEDDYLVLFNMHHIASDGWSLGILVKEFCELYSASCEQRKVNLPELDIQYSDYAVWQKNWMDNGLLKDEVSYWAERLKDLPLVHQLSLDFPRPSEASFNGAAYFQKMDPSLNLQVNELAQRMTSTPFMVLQTIFALLIGRWSNEQDIAMGTTVAGRTHKEIEPLIGFFVNTLVLRTELTEDLTFEQLLEHNKEHILDAFEHQNMPFETLVEVINPERSMSHTPLFQIAFSFHNNENVAMNLPDLKFSTLDQDRNTSHFELVLNVNEFEGELVLGWSYNCDLFKEKTIQRLSQSYCDLVSQITQDADKNINQYTLVSPTEYQSLTGVNTEFNQPLEVAGSVDELFHVQFEKMAVKSPEAVAVTFNDKHLDYKTLNAKANRLAGVLVESGIESDSRVGIYQERSIEMVVSLLAILKAGATYVALDPEHPKERTEFIMDDADIEMVLLKSSHLESINLTDVEFLLVDDAATDDNWLEEFSADNLAHDYEQLNKQLAYILYTSGSTGKPKGVMIAHNSLAHYINYAANDYFTEQTVGAVVSTPLCFDATITSLLVPLTLGKQVALLSEGKQFLDELGSYLTEQTDNWVFKLTPAHLDAIALKLSEQSVSSMQHVLVIGGEQLSQQTLARWIEHRLPEATMINEYGPTEAVVGCSTYRVDKNNAKQALSAIIPIGRPMSHVELFVLNSQQQIQPFNSIGELYIGGRSLAEGYLNQASLTQRQFIVTDKVAGQSRRLYRTGDLAFWNEAGQLVFVGRADDQIKVRGYRIEPGEIEHKLKSVEGVDDALVTVKQDAYNEKYLAGYFTLKPQLATAGYNTLQLLANNEVDKESLHLLPNGMELCGINKAETEYLYDEIFRHEIYSRNGITIKEGDCIFDVGANIGTFSVFLATRFTQLKILSYEPIPVVYEKLATNSKVFGESQIIPLCLGLSDRSTETEFSFYPNMSVYSGVSKGKQDNIQIVKKFLENTEQEAEELQSSSDSYTELAETRMETQQVKVALSTVSEQIDKQNIEKIDLLKIDVERSEREVLRGIREEHWPIIQQLVVEVHDVDNAINEVESLLNRHGFTVVLEQDKDLEGTELFNLYARKTTETTQLPDINLIRWQGVTRIKEKVKKRIAHQLPEYMVPTSLTALSDFPLTGNGKIDYKALPESGEHLSSQKVFVAPKEPIEVKVCDIWRELLRVEKISLLDNFFELGGHSLLAIRLSNLVKKEFGFSYSISDVFSNPTLEEMSKSISNTLDAIELSDSYKNIEQLDEYQEEGEF